MAPVSAQQAVQDVVNHVGAAANYPLWYAGIAASARDRLFTDHNVDEQNGAWIYRQCTNEQAARSAEKTLLNTGFKGGTGGGQNPTYLYAYRITNNTQE